MTLHTTTASRNVLVHVPETRPAPRALAVIETLIDLFMGLRAHRRHAAQQHQARRDAQALRRYASSLKASEPSLASDLMAAADRCD
jgi:hypothetical protein